MNATTYYFRLDTQQYATVPSAEPDVPEVSFKLQNEKEIDPAVLPNVIRNLGNHFAAWAVELAFRDARSNFVTGISQTDRSREEKAEQLKNEFERKAGGWKHLDIGQCFPHMIRDAAKLMGLFAMLEKAATSA